MGGETPHRAASAWLGSWRLAFRMVRRSTRRHPGRALLTCLLVGVPVMVIAAGLTLVTTFSSSGEDDWAKRSGTAQAVVQDAGGAPLRSETVQRASGGTVWPIRTDTETVQHGGLNMTSTVVSIVPGHRVYDGIAELRSGRWPAKDGEVLVTDQLVERGAPTSGRVTVVDAQGRQRLVTVVGRADAPATDAGLVGHLSRTATTSTYLVQRPKGLPQQEVDRLNTTLGAHVESRFALQSPEEAGGSDGYESSQERLVLAFVATGVVAVIALLSAPAFTAGGRRARRELGLIAANGATSAQLRRQVLAQAVVLGVPASVLGALLGGGLAVLTAPLFTEVNQGNPPGPADLPWTALAGLVVVASSAAVLGAAIPAASAARVNLLQALRGVVSPPVVRSGWPVLGALVAAVGGFLIAQGATAVTGGETPVAAGGALLFAGAIGVVPWVLSRLGGLARHLPVTWRLAVRMLSRQRARSVGTVTSIMAVVTLLTALSVAGFSDLQQARRQETLSGAYGTTIAIAPQDVAGATTAMKARVGSDVHRLGAITPSPPGGRVLAALVPPGCPAASTAAKDPGAQPRCHGAVQITDGTFVIVDSVANLRGAVHLTAAQVKVLETGGVLVAPGTSARVGDARRPAQLTGVRVRTLKSAPARPTTVAGTSIPVANAPYDTDWQVRPFSTPIEAVMSPKTAQRLGLAPSGGLLWATRGEPLDRAEEQALTDRLPLGTQVQVERGSKEGADLLFAVLFLVVGLVVLVATLASSALARLESEDDLATLAAIGAAPGARRRTAAATAATTGLVGSVLGLLVGLVPGIAVAIPLTRGGSAMDGSPLPGPSVLVIPWWQLACVVIGVPAIAGAIAWLSTRRRPAMTRRTA